MIDRSLETLNVADKIHDMGEQKTAQHGVHRMFAFHCPGCEYGHSFQVPRWSWNGFLDKPTFRPSLLVNKDDPNSRCHSYVTEGRIEFLGDSFHKLAGKTVDIPDWDDTRAS